MIDNFFIVVFTMTATALSLMGVLGKYLNGDSSMLCWRVVGLWCAVETNKVVRCWRSGESWFGNVIYCWYLMPSCAKNNHWIRSQGNQSQFNGYQKNTLSHNKPFWPVWQPFRFFKVIISGVRQSELVVELVELRKRC